MGTGKIVLGGVQFAGRERKKAENLATAERLIREAAARGAQIIMTPEVVLTGFVGGNEERAMAEPIPGPSVQRFAAVAQELDVYILIGLSELNHGEILNAMAVLDREGGLMGVMRKVHINRHETSGGWRNGSAFPVWRFTTDTGSMTAGIMICYDREVPESARILMIEGADVIFNPLSCTCPTADIHRALLRTRAFENEVYVFMVNHAAPRQNGHSMAFDFNGMIVEELDEKEGVLVYEADLDALEAHRAKGIYGRHHRRPELYGVLCDPAGQHHPQDANLPPESAAGRKGSAAC
ncbi:MAG TPA: carbon-nitrogen hydrolase family protein [Candidatus Hydrogenedentes bacterium]|nr:carbon-nitrogen hydrolase family protein [Candidatus Hydrogenedentota bacterium]HPG67272.1 carbon-nitrogen hydrolase family protein [Candidatus Hydrogenedentota bacterium]